MTISTKFDLGQIVYTIVNDDIRKMLIRSVFVSEHDPEPQYGLRAPEYECDKTVFKGERKIFASRQELIDNLLKDE